MNNVNSHPISWDKLTKEAGGMLKKLFPICRSITGNGVRQTLSILKEVVEFNVKEIPSGTVCYDWKVPEEWNVRDAYIKDSSGKKIVDFQKNNLHLVSYSIPMDKTMSFQELEKHLHTLPDLAGAIPYRTSYYNKDWGFCLSYDQYNRMDKKGRYHVKIDSTLKRGALTFGEGLIKGKSGQEFFFSTYCCHPSLANDNVSGQVLWALLFRELKKQKTRHSYRFVIAPETIGAIAYLSRNEEAMRKITGGFVITSVAGPGRLGYKHTYLGNHLIDRVVRKTFSELKTDYISYPFDINGSDEIHYSAPAFRIPLGTICKDKYYEYDYYHTSFDDLGFISAKNLIETLKIYLSVIEKLEMNLTYRSLNPYCEPNLGKRGLYPKIGGHIKQRARGFKKHHNEQRYVISEGKVIYGNELDIMRWLIFESDGKASLLDISERFDFSLKQFYEAGEKLREHGLVAIAGKTRKSKE